jgi:prolyl oligopeptidase
MVRSGAWTARLISLFFASALSLCACGADTPVAQPPLSMTPLSDASSERASTLRTKKVDVVEDFHGTRVPDPYRWLEEADGADVKAWTETENATTRGVLDAYPGRDALKKQLAELLHIGYVSGPTVRTVKPGLRRYFHTKREGEANQPTLYVRDKHDGKDRVLLDASTLSADGTTAVDWWYPSWDGTKVAWGASESGSEESTLFIRDVATGKDLEDKVTRTRHASVAWLPSGKEFYYSRYPEAGTVPPGDEKYMAKIYHHVIGRDAKEDELVFGGNRDKTDVPQVMISPNGRWLVVRVHEGWGKSEVYLMDLQKKPDAKGERKWTEIAVGMDAIFDPIPRDDRLWMLTNDGAPKYRFFSLDYPAPDRTHWKEVLVEGKDVLTDVTVVGSELVATYLHEASTRIERFTLEGKSKGEIPLPAIGTASVSAPQDGDEVFIDFASYVTPYQVTRYELKTGKTNLWDRVGAEFSAQSGAEGVKVSLLYATSKDGTKIPMFVVAKDNLPKDGNNPTILWGYGGFNVNQTPAFSSRALLTVKHGGVWVSAILRGGGEFGEDWHKAGMLAKKQNVFDDYIACAEELIAQKITSPAKLGIMGGSNGGLLVAAAVTQRPVLFRVGASLVPLTDMLRYHRFRIAKLWIPEYGDPEKPEDFKTLFAYSPYHHVKAGTKYPSMLFTSAESDSRVDPMHARKMAARMQEVGDALGTTKERPVLLRIESKAGHGAGKPTSKLNDEIADELSFLFHELGVKE